MSLRPDISSSEDPASADRASADRATADRATADSKAGDVSNKPGLSKVIERNIRTMIALNRAEDKRRSGHQVAVDAITNFAGHISFVYIHVAWFAAWVILNSGAGGNKPFDAFPYGLLTMIVSLEAIFLSTLVLITQNRLSAQAEYRADLNLQISLLTEHELTRVLQMLDAIQAKLGIENHEPSDLADLEMETKPEDVIAEIELLRRAAKR